MNTNPIRNRSYRSRLLVCGLSGVLCVGTAVMPTPRAVAAEGTPGTRVGDRKPNDLDMVGEERAVLTQAPFVPPPIKRAHPSKLIVELEVKEVVKKLSDGVEYLVWTFGGDVPGSFIRIREGDMVEFHLLNHPSSKMPHNIDLHAVTGPGAARRRHSPRRGIDLSSPSRRSTPDSTSIIARPPRWACTSRTACMD